MTRTKLNTKGRVKGKKILYAHIPSGVVSILKKKASGYGRSLSDLLTEIITKYFEKP